ncbi:Amino acid permease-like protein [Apophysomyces sp. BC1034]|nr:Amino acid permease-like protein [Apophysomyces sp. BC1034]
MAFAFTCSHVAFNNYLTLHDQSSRAWCLTTALATFTSWGGSMVFGIIGYLCFGSDVKSNLFLNFPADDPVVNLGRLALACSMILGIPTAFFPTREAVQKSLGFETSTTQPTTWQHYSVTVILFYILVVLGITIRDLGSVYRVAGGISATALAFILPGIAYLVTRYRTQPAVYPTLTVTTTVAPDEWDKPQIFSDVDSIASSSKPIIDEEEDISTVDGDPNDLIDLPQPSWWLDVACIILIVWGFFVMVFSTSGAFSS